MDLTDPIRENYDRVAGEYARRIYGELAHKPLDRQLLNRFADATAGQGKVCDMGCGPGHIARYLHDAGAAAFGLDLSPAMLDQARQLNPGMEFRLGNLLAPDLETGSLAGITAFYAIVNLPLAVLPGIFREMHRVLQPGGLLLLAFHIGDEARHVTELWGCAVSMDFYFFPPETIRGLLLQAGFAVEETVERDPYPDVEHPSRRAYIFARKPGI
ncbi:MAG TPA: class I SAM-dependent methyltransferase [Acidobacteriaceae bacterium]|nr:class I SAM-dependent methyltransferase [Acidobacteriaceae bacterium]